MTALVRFGHLIPHEGDQSFTLCGEFSTGEAVSFYDPAPEHELDDISSEAICRKCFIIHSKRLDSEFVAELELLSKRIASLNTEIQVKQKLLEVCDQDLDEDMKLFDKVIAVMKTATFPDDKAKKQSQKLRKALDRHLRDWNEDYG